MDADVSTYWLIGWRLSHLNVDVWILSTSIEVLPLVIRVQVLALVIALAIAIGLLVIAVARVEFLDFVRGVDIGPLDIVMLRVEVLAPVVGVELLPFVIGVEALSLVIGIVILALAPVVCLGVCIGIGIGIAIARAVARFFVKASCKHGHSIELPKAGFPLVRRVQHLCFWLVFFPLASALFFSTRVDFLWNIWGGIGFVFFLSIVYFMVLPQLGYFTSRGR